MLGEGTQKAQNAQTRFLFVAFVLFVFLPSLVHGLTFDWF
jgi:hypothetical protein